MADVAEVMVLVVVNLVDVDVMDAVVLTAEEVIEIEIDTDQRLRADTILLAIDRHRLGIDPSLLGIGRQDVWRQGLHTEDRLFVHAHQLDVTPTTSTFVMLKMPVASASKPPELFRDECNSEP